MTEQHPNKQEYTRRLSQHKEQKVKTLNTLIERHGRVSFKKQAGPKD